MSVTDFGVNRAQRLLDAIEPWKIDHDAAMACRDVEDRVEEGLAVWTLIRMAHDRVTRAIYRNDLSPQHPAVEQVKVLLVTWLETAEFVVPELTKMEGHFEMANAGEFRDVIEEAETLLGKWPATLQSLAPGMHPWKVTDEEAAKMTALRNANPGSPGVLSRDLKPTLLGNASLIR